MYIYVTSLPWPYRQMYSFFRQKGGRTSSKSPKTLGKRILKCQTGQARATIKQNEGTIICNWYQRLKFINKKAYNNTIQ